MRPVLWLPSLMSIGKHYDFFCPQHINNLKRKPCDASRVHLRLAYSVAIETPAESWIEHTLKGGLDRAYESFAEFVADL